MRPGRRQWCARPTSHRCFQRCRATRAVGVASVGCSRLHLRIQGADAGTLCRSGSLAGIDRPAQCAPKCRVTTALRPQPDSTAILGARAQHHARLKIRVHSQSPRDALAGDIQTPELTIPAQACSGCPAPSPNRSETKGQHGGCIKRLPPSERTRLVLPEQTDRNAD